MIVRFELILALVVMVAQSAFAGATTPNCEIEVRLLGRSGEGTPTLDSDLDEHPDLGEQLKAIPASELHLLQSEKKRLPLLDSGTFHLKDEHGAMHNVEVVPREVTGSRVHIGVNWSGPQGEAIVSTLLHVDDGSHVVIGSDKKKSPMVVCIRVHCDSAHGG